MKEMIVLPMSLTVEAWPMSPQWMAFAPNAISTGITSCSTSLEPPVMIRRVPFSAPIFEPVTGASSMSAPLARSTSATRRARPGEIVDVSM
jgi:hypothetical protein